MSTDKVIFKEKLEWKGREYITEYIDSVDFEKVGPITQVQAICFDKQGDFVIYEGPNKFFGLPGGTVEDETLEEALFREIKEEIACNVISYKPLLYLKITNPAEEPIRTTYQARYAAQVDPFSDQIDDPAGKTLRRLHISDEVEVKNLLNWGRKLDLYLERARAAYD